MTDTQTEVTREDMNLRSEIWNTLGHDQALGLALTRYGMSRFNETLDEIIARHRIASQSDLQERIDALEAALQHLCDELADSDEEGLIEHAEPMIRARAALKQEKET